MTTITTIPEWRKPVISVPLTQAFPAFGTITEFKKKRCIFNHDRTKLFNVVSEKYQVIDHASAIDTIQRALVSAFGEDLAAEATLNVRSIADGARIRAEWKLPFVAPIQVAKGDLINPTLVMRNSHDGAWKFSAVLGAFRLVCSNGMVIGEKFGSVSGKHFPTMGEMESFSTQINAMIQNAEKLAPLWKEWSQTPIAFEEAVDLLDEKFPEKYLVAVLDEKSYPKSKWDLYNQLTAFSTHDTKSLNRRIEFDDTIARLFYHE